MTADSTGSSRLIGTLHSADGVGLLHIEDHFDTSIDDLWSAITDPERLRRWFGEISGDLRPGGRFRSYNAGDDIESAGRIEACERPRHLHVISRETDESYRRGQGVPPFDASIDATLSPAGHRTLLVAEIRGMPLDKVMFYGTGWQIHTEHLADYLAGREPGDVERRWEELVPLYQELAARSGL